MLHGAQLVLYQLLAQRGNAVDEHLAIKVVKLMLHHPGKVSLHPFVMLLQLVVKVTHMDAEAATF